MKKNINLILWVTILLISLKFQAQNTQFIINSTLNGTVLDKITQQPLPGVNVQIKGTTHGVTTDIDGKFFFETGQKFPYTLIVSIIGYKRLQVVADGSPIKIELEEDVQQLKELVVVGYGTQNKKNITGSVSSIPKASLNQVTSSADNLLRGAVAGVVVTQSSGQPGASSSIRIRGGNSITGGNEPLYVIDGILVYNDNNNSSTGLSFAGASLNVLATLNPSDIESIEVLKDASATAIYGSRGANGVILITTKKGKKGQNNITYQGYFGFQDVTKKLDILNASEWATLRNDIQTGLGQTPTFTPQQIEDFKTTGNYDWQDAAFRKAAPIQNHQLSFSGGDETSRYSVSTNYFKQEGIIIGSDFRRLSLRINYEKDVSDLFRFGVTSTLTNSLYNGMGSNSGSVALTAPNTLASALLIAPVVPIRNADGSFNVKTNPYVASINGYITNPINDLENITNETKINRTLSSLWGEYKIVKNLAFKSTVNADVISTKQNYYAPSNTTNGVETKGYASVGNKLVGSVLNENTLNYNTSFGEDKHQLSALVGYTIQYSQGEVATSGATNFVNDLIEHNALQDGIPIKPTSDAYESVLESWLGRVNYSLLSRYNFSVSARADGSSRFGSEYKWGFFPSAGFSWNITEENFAKNIKGIDNIKLRLSAGTTGNQEIGDYLSLAALGSVNYAFGGTVQTGFAPTRLSNEDLKWEKTTQYNVGLDFDFLNKKINLVLDAYYKKTSDLLVNVPIPLITGQTSVLQNIGAVENKGFEIGLITENIKTDSFSWNTNFNYSLNKNKVLKIGNGIQQFFPTAPSGVLNLQQPVIVKVGQPLGTFWGYKTDGIFQNQNEINTQPTLNSIANTKLGDRRYKDISGPNGVPDGKITAAYDKVNLGSAQPKFVASLNNTLVYRDWDLNFFFQGAFGGKIYNAINQQLEIPTLGNNAAGALRDHWTTTNPSEEIPRAANSPATVVSDRYIEDGSFIRLKTVTLGYTLPKNIASKIKTKAIKFYVSAQNLVTWTKYSGFDPEISSYSQSNLLPGIDYGAYPTSRTFISGVNVTF
ncbi:SusC/RagA family TonB-linked outer membrane protein [Flavobacterium hydrophilum]|uniref:SusC/RagA family protein n=1 Tax=Flavobacterium hydrophilum TaxID=2211445 RepID=A0A2V4C4B9_9FLAO|nr:TonB-dependent receptor [Flavobacterium hydrophilum]PXY46158.1 SusC/RagA family protein [Flavobacterium hydrophilum]